MLKVHLLQPEARVLITAIISTNSCQYKRLSASLGDFSSPASPRNAYVV